MTKLPNKNFQAAPPPSTGGRGWIASLLFSASTCARVRASKASRNSIDMALVNQTIWIMTFCCFSSMRARTETSYRVLAATPACVRFLGGGQ